MNQLSDRLNRLISISNAGNVTKSSELKAQELM